MENVRKIKIKLENIWIDLLRSIYAPYKERMNFAIRHKGDVVGGVGEFLRCGVGVLPQSQSR